MFVLVHSISLISDWNLKIETNALLASSAFKLKNPLPFCRKGFSLEWTKDSNF